MRDRAAHADVADLDPGQQARDPSIVEPIEVAMPAE